MNTFTRKSTLLLLYNGLFLFSFGNTEKILSVVFWSTKSNKMTYEPLLEALATRGHNITIVSPVASTKSIPNLQELLTVDFGQFMSSLKYQIPNIYDMKERNQKLNPMHYMSQVLEICAFSYDLAHVQALRKEKFDLILLPMSANECVVGYAHGFNTSTILISPTSVSGHISSIFGNPSPPSFMPNSFTAYTDRMDFYQRTVNFLTEIAIRGIFHYIYIPSIELLYREKLNDPNIPSVIDLLKKSSLILSNGHPILSKVRPLLPDIIEVGGMHCHPSQPLPNELNEFVKSAGSDGFIVFSMGSVLEGRHMPETKRVQILTAFSKLKQKVIWKWEADTMPNLPSNVKLCKWLPQQDLLGQANIKAFITHGGFGSITEAVYHGVPLIGFPMFAEQYLNMEVAETSGFAITLDFSKFTEAELTESLSEIIDDPRYMTNAKILSKIFRDQPNTPLERAVYWTEYVMRHKGAPHLRSPARNFNFFQYHSIDVIVFLVFIIFITIWLTFMIFSIVLCKFFKFFNGNGSMDKSRLSLKTLKEKCH